MSDDKPTEPMEGDVVVSPEELKAILEDEPKLKGMVHVVDGVVCIGSEDEIPTAEELRENMKNAKKIRVGGGHGTL
jgi:hypothetical protein